MGTKYQHIFQRKEKKYMLTEEQYQLISPELSRFLRADEFGKYTICSLYFDDDDYTLARLSAAKPRYKEKFRLRSYGTPGVNDVVYAELKKKTDGVVYKRRAALSCGEAESTFLSGTLPDADSQIMREIGYFLERWQPHPKTLICYDRLAFAGIEEPSLRVTFDFSPRWRGDELLLSAGDHGTPVFRANQHCLMEIKTSGSMPFILARLLSEYAIFPTSFSKYGTVYRDFLLPEVSAKWNGMVSQPAFPAPSNEKKGGFSHANAG